ncbi:MAG TPA: hypothetical protein VGG85_19875 [Terracidiphilus sp.]|jgi:hypothetical protein
MAENNKDQNNVVPSAPSDIPSEWAHLKPEDITQLHTVRKEALVAQKAADEARARVLELERSNTDLRRQEAIRDAFAESGVRFHKQSDALTLLGEIEFGSDGKPSVNGVPLAKAVQILALENENLVSDKRSIRSLKEKAENSVPKSKSDLDQAAKIKFIDENGLRAFEALPNRPPVTLNGRLPSSQEWRHMSVSQKTAVVARHGSSIVFKITRGDFDKK